MIVSMICVTLCVFFFSSRRRHTRFDCDWSQTCALPISHHLVQRLRQPPQLVLHHRLGEPAGQKSERRRVGEECRFRGSPYYLKKKKGGFMIIPMLSVIMSLTLFLWFLLPRVVGLRIHTP